MNDRINSRDNAVANLVRSGVMLDGLKTLGIFHAECLDKYGRVKWRDTAPNVVTTEGKNAMLDKFLALGAAYAACVMGLHTTVGNAASTYATPSPQVEALVGTYALRIAPAWSVAAAGVKSTSAAVSFPIIGSQTIAGSFIALGASGITAVGNTALAAVLYSSGAFTGGARPVVGGDTLNVTYSSTLT
jgi:hypothetical protein